MGTKDFCRAAGTTERIINVGQENNLAGITELTQSTKIKALYASQAAAVGDLSSHFIKKMDPQSSRRPNAAIDRGAETEAQQSGAQGCERDVRDAVAAISELARTWGEAPR